MNACPELLSSSECVNFPQERTRTYLLHHTWILLVPFVVCGELFEFPTRTFLTSTYFLQAFGELLDERPALLPYVFDVLLHLQDKDRFYAVTK